MLYVAYCVSVPGPAGRLIGYRQPHRRAFPSAVPGPPRPQDGIWPVLFNLGRRIATKMRETGTSCAANGRHGRRAWGLGSREPPGVACVVSLAAPFHARIPCLLFFLGTQRASVALRSHRRSPSTSSGLPMNGCTARPLTHTPRREQKHTCPPHTHARAQPIRRRKESLDHQAAAACNHRAARHTLRPLPDHTGSFRRRWSSQAVCLSDPKRPRAFAFRHTLLVACRLV